MLLHTPLLDAKTEQNIGTTNMASVLSASDSSSEAIQHQSLAVLKDPAEEDTLECRKVTEAAGSRLVDRTDPTLAICCCPCPRTGGWVGHNVHFYGTVKRGVFPLFCMVGPDWNCLIVTYLLIIVPWIVFTIIKTPYLNIVAQIVGYVLGISHVATLMVLTLSDPGVLPKAELSDSELQDKRDDGLRVCPYCKIVRPPRAQHCYICNVCVLELDHHCPWTGKCIGKNNIRFFYLFLVFIPISIGFMVLSSVFKME